MKICRKCGEEKEEVKFSKAKNSKDGLSSWCKKCYKEYYKSNKEHWKEYYKNNAEKKRDYNKEWYKNNKKYQREYYKNNVEKRREYHKNNTEKMSEQKKEYLKSSALYNIFAHQISYAEEVRHDPEDKELLQVKCTHCSKWFNPMNKEVRRRVRSLEGKGHGEGRFYCSDGCKQLCPIYRQHKYPKDQKPYYSRNDQKDWAEMVKERDGYKCVKCGLIEGLIAHHKEGIHWNPIESADIDMGITLCEGCEKEVHSIEGCSYYDMRCN